MLFEAPYQFLVLDDDPSINDYVSEIVKRTSNLNEKLNLIHCNNWKSAMDCGMDYFVSKPLTLKKLKNQIVEAYGNNNKKKSA